MVGVLVQCFVGVTAEVEVRSSVVTFPLCKIASGMRVRHASLGPGTVHKLEGKGDELRVIVMFDEKGARKLLARVAGLRPL